MIKHLKDQVQLKNCSRFNQSFEKDFSIAEQQIYQLLSEKTALENLNCDIRSKLTKKKKRTNTLESILAQKENEIIQHKEEVHVLKNGVRQLTNDLSSLQKEIFALLSEKTTLEQLNCDFAKEKTRIITLKNNLVEKVKKIVQL